MGALVERFAFAGIRFKVRSDGKLIAHGQLTDEQRDAIRANKSAILAELQQEHQGDPATEMRRQRVLALLAANPALRIAVVAEAGDPAIVGIAIRGKAYGELEIQLASYDGLALLALIERHGSESGSTLLH